MELLARKKSKKEGDFFDKLREKTREAKEISSSIGKVTLERSEEIGKQLAQKGKVGIDKGKESLDKGIASAKRSTVSKTESIELIEKLGKLKESGLITEKEFQQKKKQLLENI
jgi:hypothetical protein